MFRAEEDTEAMKVVYLQLKIPEPRSTELDKTLEEWGLHICTVTDAFQGVIYEGVKVIPGKTGEVTYGEVKEQHRSLEKCLDIWKIELFAMHITGRSWDIACGDAVKLHPKIGKFVPEEYPV